MKTTIQVTCKACGNSHQIDAYGGINLADTPELKAGVKDGSLFVWNCPVCGASNLATYQTIYHDPAERVLIWLLPEGSLSEDKVEVIGKQMEESSDFPDGYIFRRVKDVGSLIEKVNIFDAGLDDATMEICKYVTKMELVEKSGAKDLLQAPFKFYRTDGPDNDIEFSYPSEGKMHGVRIGFNVYGDCAGILRRNPSIKPSGGFAIIDQAWVDRYFG